MSTPISKLFPNKRLSKEEAAWIKQFQNWFCFDPHGTEFVTDEASFYEMVEENTSWMDAFVQEGIEFLDKKKYELPHFKTVIYPL